jgi:glycosyltransferase involved in cell wall biosynthesis
VVGRQGTPWLALNGKWLSQETTGTQRYAREVTRHLLPLLPDRPVLHVPAGAAVPDWLRARVDVRRSRLRGTAFEQFALPWAARHHLVLSLGGAAPLLARRQVATMHDATPFRFPQTYSRAFGTWYRLMYRTVGRRAERILTVSAFSRSELTAVLSVTEDRVVVVPNGSEHIAVDGPGEPVDGVSGHFVLMVGPPAAHKNIAPVASALAQRGIDVVVVGGGAAGRVFESVDRSSARPDGGAGAVTRVGRVSDEHVHWLYRHASVLVFPSLYEGFGLPVVEAQRLGCPVVASDRASLPEVAGDGALLVDPTDADAVARHVVTLLGDPERLAQLRIRGRENADRFRWAASAAKVAATLSGCTGG